VNTRVAITGVSGFVGAHVLEYFLHTTDWEIVCLVRMSRAGNLNRLESIVEGYNLPKRVQIIRHDLIDPLDSVHRHIGEVDYIVHVAADSHVDDSITRPREVFVNNSLSTISMLDYARKYQTRLKRFIYYSTDEVYGDAEVGSKFKETDALNPRNPYSAGKASGEMIANAYMETYGLPITIMRTMNMFGERQDPEKFVPKIVGHILRGEKVPIHHTGGVVGSRYWLYAKNSASAILYMLEQNEKKINVGSEVELSNLEMAQKVADIMGQELKYEMVEAKSIRPGYDRRYSIDYSKILELGWRPPFDFDNALEQTVKFSMNNPEWVK